MDPFDAAVLACLAASGLFAILIAVIVRCEVVHTILGFWPLLMALSGVAWLTSDRWAPMDAPRWRQVGMLVLFVCLEALAVAPLVAISWEVAGPSAVLGAALATGATFAGLAVFALVKPTTYLEPIDPLIVFGLIALALVMVALGLGLPLGFVWAAPLIAVTGVLVLDQTANVAAYAMRGQAAAGGTRLFGCLSVLFAEFIYYFVSMVRGEGFLWGLLVRVAVEVAS